MTVKQLLKAKSDFQKEVERAKLAVDKNYTVIHDQFVKEHSPIERGKVYDIVEGASKRCKSSRVVVYSQQISYFDHIVMIRAGVWYLDANNNPVKWDTLTVYGVGNPAVLKLSENQNNNKPKKATP